MKNTRQRRPAGWLSSNAQNRLCFPARFQESFYVGLGIVFYPGRNARTANGAGDRWVPYLPVANNGSFMVDTDRTF